MNRLKGLSDSATTAVATVAAKATMGGIKAVDGGFSLMAKALDTKAGRKISDGFGKLMSTKIGRTVFTGLMLAPAMGTYVAAAGADATISKIMSIVQKGVTAIGSIVVVVGAIQFGLAWKDDDSAGKTRGAQTMVGGGIVAAVGAISDLFQIEQIGA
jgi:hypothetical protein